MIRRELGDRRALAGCWEGLARVAGALGQPGRAAWLFGAAEVLRDTLGAPLAPADRADNEREIAAARAVLGEEAFAAAWAEGRALSLDGAIKYALED